MKNFYIVRRQVLLGISALLCTTLLLFGCQDQAIPVAPHADDPVVLGKKPGGGGGSQPATLDIAFPMETTGLAVTVGQDSRKKFQVSNNAFVHDIQMNFNDEPCFTWNSPTPEQKEALVSELSNKVQSGNITMTIDKTGLVLGGEGTQSSGHSLMVDYEGTLGPTRISVAHTPAQPPYVKWVSHSEDPNVDVFQFVGYVIVTWQRGKNYYNNRIVGCQPQEMVEVTVSR